MNAGKLRHKVELQSYATSRDDFGAELETWSTYAKIWASINPSIGVLAGKEFILGQQVSEESRYEITIRYNSSVDVKHRVKFGLRLFDINVIKNIDEKNEYMILMCSEAS